MPPSRVAEPGTAPAAELKTRVAEAIRSGRAEILALSHRIHADPEVRWQEHAAAAAVAEFLTAAGLDPVVGAYGVETAVEAVRGEGELTAALCAEYDALPGIGHACGHNMIAAMSSAAAVALASVAAEAGLRVKLLGTPAEESGGGKVALLKAGAFEDVAFALMVHPDTGDDVAVSTATTTAIERFEVVFTGRAAHAAAAPHRGVNAGAAATLALTAIGLARQMIPPSTSANAVITDGGAATNIIPERTALQVEVRAGDLAEWQRVKDQILACFEGAAIATGCSWSYVSMGVPYAPMRHDPTLSAMWDQNLHDLGRTISYEGGAGGGSTDMGNVSQVVPAIHGKISIPGSDAVPHRPDFTAAAVTPEADDTVIEGAIALAWTALDAAMTPDARAQLLARRAARPAGATRHSFGG
jgi:amidohydrolase